MLYERGPDLYAIELHRNDELVDRVDGVFFDDLGRVLEQLIDDGRWRQIRIETFSVHTETSRGSQRTTSFTTKR